MKNKTLINKLQSNRDSLSIKIWDGLIGDFLDIKDVTSMTLFRVKFKIYLELVAKQEKRNVESYSEEEIEKLKLSHNKHYPWEDNIDEEFKKLYDSKEVLVIEPKIMGKQCFDRGGSILY
jgi:hypothetical protein